MKPTRTGLGHWLLAFVFIGLGIIGLVSGDFASVWQNVSIEPGTLRQSLAYLSAVVELAIGIGLLVPMTVTLACRVFVVVMVLWIVLIKIPGIVAAPTMEATWLGFGEIAVILSGAWVLYACNAAESDRRRLSFAVGDTGVRNARLLFAIALPMIGLSHFFYSKETAGFVPAWLPFHLEWAYITGAGSIAASLGILFSVLPRLAATMEAAMLVIITVLVWFPGIAPAPMTIFQWTGFLISSAIACGAWVVADSYRGTPWLTVGRKSSASRVR